MLSSPQPDDFSHAFEAAFARLQVVVEEGYAARGDWPVRIAAAIRAGFEFAADDPETANVLTNEAISRGRDGFARYNRLVDWVAETEGSFRDDRLGEVPVADLLILPISEMADRWRT